MLRPVIPGISEMSLSISRGPKFVLSRILKMSRSLSKHVSEYL
jgi:hypothetical protein